MQQAKVAEKEEEEEGAEKEEEEEEICCFALPQPLLPPFTSSLTPPPKFKGSGEVGSSIVRLLALPRSLLITLSDGENILLHKNPGRRAAWPHLTGLGLHSPPAATFCARLSHSVILPDRAGGSLTPVPGLASLACSAASSSCAVCPGFANILYICVICVYTYMSV